VWFGAERVRHPADLHGPIDYVSYSPYARGHDPKDHVRVTAEQIEGDLSALTDVARGVRTYSTIDGIDQVPAVAEQLGLNVVLGAWVGDTPERTANEIESVVQLAREHRNVRSVLVGNEVLFRDEMTPDELIAHIKDVKRQVRVPVSTGELYEYWLENPKLVNAVDFIAVHILPYWDGMPADKVIA
jgi:exo-beta-1,3-glucanase (GH17 family)